MTYNRRSFSNQTVNDALGLGCDRFNSKYTLEECNDLYLNHTHPDYGFYSVTAPSKSAVPCMFPTVTAGARMASPKRSAPTAAASVTGTSARDRTYGTRPTRSGLSSAAGKP